CKENPPLSLPYLSCCRHEDSSVTQTFHAFAFWLGVRSPSASAAQTTNKSEAQRATVSQTPRRVPPSVPEPATRRPHLFRKPQRAAYSAGQFNNPARHSTQVPGFQSSSEVFEWQLPAVPFM